MKNSERRTEKIEEELLKIDPQTFCFVEYVPDTVDPEKWIAERSITIKELNPSAIPIFVMFV